MVAMSAVSAPPPSPVAWIERMRLVRVAVNVEQLLYRSPGGVGRYTAAVAGRLPAEVPGTEVVAFAARHPHPQVAAALAAAGAGGEPVVLPLPRPLLYEAWLGPGLLGPARLSARVRAADVVHAPSAAVPPRGAAPLVVTIHDAAPALFPEAFPRRGLRFHRRGLAAAARRADLVITPSHAAAEEVAAHSGIAADRLRVVPNGVDAPPADPPAAAAVRRRLGLGERPFVLWVGSLEPRKGVGTLVAAAARLAAAGVVGASAAAVVLAGYEGWMQAGLVDDADRRALGAALVEAGRVGEGDLWALYDAATVVAVPSRHEGFGYPVLEAMARGTAVVASDIPALREVAGGAARLVPAGDVAAWAAALGELLADPAAAAQAGRGGRARAGELSLGASLAATAAVYAEVTGAAGPPGGARSGR